MGNTRTMRRRVAIGALATLGVLGLWALPPSGMEPGHTDQKPRRPPDEWDLGDMKAAQEYASWCGGVVQVAKGGPYVVSCDE